MSDGFDRLLAKRLKDKNNKKIGNEFYEFNFIKALYNWLLLY